MPLTVLNFSGGRQSSCLLWMLLRGDLERPDHLLVLNADPGMENERTYTYVREMFERCAEAGIEARTVEGPNLYRDLVELSDSGRTRIDHPPYWTRNPDGSVGRLRQTCTKHYKIAPIDREIRRVLHERFYVGKESKRLPRGVVEKWIGFSASEVHRVKPPAQRYVTFRYPLIELGMRDEDVEAYFERNNLPMPPRSVCNACFANSVAHLRSLSESDFEQACRVDDAIRDMSQVGVEHPVYVSRTMRPLRDLRDVEDPGDLDAGYSCDSGYCFT